VRYELLGCALGGHFLVGTDVATVTGADAAVVRQRDGLRWHRCLRCDAWIPLAVPDAPTRPTMPARDEIDVPLRGRALRDRFVLRLIAAERALHVIAFVSLAVLIFVFLGHRRELASDYDRVMDAINGGSGGHGFLSSFQHVFTVSPTELAWAGVVLFVYAGLEATEMVGLWFAKRWAEYLTFLATLGFVPFEVYELVRAVSALKALTFVVNMAIAVYLLVAKRLFGLRGGAQEPIPGWEAVDLATPGAVG
jgi:uncharacterized membrane protein (DUF2068 family)